MPLWRIFSHPSAFTPSQRQSLSQAIISIYVNRNLPAFYVNVLFVDLEASSIYVGGDPRTNFVRIAAENIARRSPDLDSGEGKERAVSFMDTVCEVLKPHLQRGLPKELDWEIHFTYTPRELWRIQGMDPPPPNSEAERDWKSQDKASPFSLSSA